MIPTVDEIQHFINQLVDLVLGVSKEVVWKLEYSRDGTKNKGKSLPVFTWKENPKVRWEVDMKDLYGPVVYDVILSWLGSLFVVLLVFSQLLSIFWHAQ